MFIPLATGLLGSNQQREKIIIFRQLEVLEELLASNSFSSLLLVAYANFMKENPGQKLVIIQS
jgi:hypothetical protein